MGLDGDEACAAAWHRDGDGTWSSEKLGCHGVPEAMTVLVDGRIAAAFWSTLWLRQPYASEEQQSRA